MHQTIDPAILYWGSVVVLITTENEDGTPNIAPMSSAWWLGQRCMLGLAAMSQTTINLRRTKQCVLNLPSESLVAHVNKLAKTTGSPELPSFKQEAGYRFVKDKFAHADLTPQKSEHVTLPRIQECPVQMEAQLEGVTEMSKGVDRLEGFILGLEVKILKVYAEDRIMMNGSSKKVNADAWRPLIMNFQHFYGLGGRLDPSRLAEIDEEKYRGLQEDQYDE
ncbi:hypothetical protein ACLMJK_008671 [Lecanora helva]